MGPPHMGKCSKIFLLSLSHLVPPPLPSWLRGPPYPLGFKAFPDSSKVSPALSKAISKAIPASSEALLARSKALSADADTQGPMTNETTTYTE